jgi:hypothetical protein
MYIGNYDDICSPDEDAARFGRSLRKYSLGSAWYEASADGDPCDDEDEVSDDE